MTTQPNFAELKHLNEWVQWQNKMEFDHEDRDWIQYEWVLMPGTTRHQPLGNDYSENLCGSAYCVAGKAIQRAGHVITQDTGLPSGRILIDGEWGRSIPDMATEILGLDDATADALFGGANTAEDIDDIIRQIFTEHGVNYEQQAPAL